PRTDTPRTGYRDADEDVPRASETPRGPASTRMSLHNRDNAGSSSRLLLLDLVVQEHLEDVEAREDLPEDLHLEGVAVRPLQGRDPRVQPLRERDVGLPRRVVRPEL